LANQLRKRYEAKKTIDNNVHIFAIFVGLCNRHERFGATAAGSADLKGSAEMPPLRHVVRLIRK
jgi:hypothetical protein